MEGMEEGDLDEEGRRVVGVWPVEGTVGGAATSGSRGC